MIVDLAGTPVAIRGLIDGISAVLFGITIVWAEGDRSYLVGTVRLDEFLRAATAAVCDPETGEVLMTAVLATIESALPAVGEVRNAVRVAANAAARAASS